ncbi:MAG: hypothetical protein AAF600_18340 [Bacteroidota bacterium]
MKCVIHIEARLLTTYFIALPVLLGCHTIEHQYDYIEDYGDGLVYTQFTSDCVFCDLYHSRTASIETSFLCITDLHLVYFLPGFIEDHAEVSYYLNFLRGPPIA